MISVANISPGTTGASMNENTNFTRIIKSTTVNSDQMTIGPVVISGTSISGLVNPMDASDIVNKVYTDSSGNTSFPGGPVDSVQISSGTSFNGYSNFIYNSGLDAIELTNATYTQNNGTLVINNQFISGINKTVDVPTLGYYSSNTSIATITKSTSSKSTNLAPTDIYNKFITRTSSYTSTDLQDILPNDTSVISYIKNQLNLDSIYDGFYFHFFYYYTGNSTRMSLFGNIIPPGFYNANNTQSINVCTIVSNSVIKFKALIVNSHVYYYIMENFIIYSPTFYPNSPIVNTSNFVTSSLLIYANSPIIINDSNSHTYTLDELNHLLIIRDGLTTGTTDTFDTLSSPVQGSFRCSIRNSTNYTLTIGAAPSGWSYSSFSIPAKNNAYLFFYYNGTTMYLNVISIAPYNG
jgi:hypothetical protein